MDTSTGILPIGNSLQDIQFLLQNLPTDIPDYSSHFSQAEEFFIQFSDEISIPQIPIHHDVRNMRPDPALSGSLRTALEAAFSAAPGLFKGMNYFFLPQDPIKPCLYSLVRLKSHLYMILFRLDLSYRPNQFTMIKKGTNDISAAYSCRRLYLEADILPIQEIKKNDDKQNVHAVVSRSISDTWIGESGRGYLLQGIWIDRDITRFLSKTVTPPGTRIYPYYPLNCKYQATCHNLIELHPENRKQTVPRLHRFHEFLQDYVGPIQQVLKAEKFSPDMPLLKEIQDKIPHSWNEYLEHVSLEPYLNPDNQKEFRVHYEPRE